MSNYTHYVSIDFGTSGCAIAVGLANPDPSNVKVFSAWIQGQTGVSWKYPTVLLTDPNGGFSQFGEEALKVHKMLRAVADPGWGIWGKCPPSRNCIQDRDTLIEQSITLIKQSQCP